MRPALFAGGGACAAAIASGGPLAAPLLLLLRAGLLAWPFVAAVRLYQSGKRRAALTLALSAACRRFCTRWWQYCTIPLFAGLVGWVTNKVAVDMIFYPVEFAGLRLKTYPEQPLGWIGWQGIVPAKAGTMAARLTELITTKLVDVKEVFGRLSPDRVSTLLGPGVDRILTTVVGEMVPGSLRGGVLGTGVAALKGLPADAQAELLALRHRYVADLTRDMQEHVHELVDFNELVVGGMVREKRLLIDLFQRCGKEELAFLVNSGFGFGCALGVLQMLVWLFYEAPWTLAVGGAVVGYLTNWIALKLIFEPVEPTRFGPFVLQGMFLKRQHEVSAEFADAMTEKLLSSQSVWDHVLHGSGSANFEALLHQRTSAFMASAAAVIYGGGTQPREFADPRWWVDLESRATRRTMELLPAELPAIHGYVDDALGLQDTLKQNLRRLTPAQFERVLHPVFQEDELTLIFVGSVLGLAVGYAQAAWDARSKKAQAARDAAVEAADAKRAPLPGAGSAAEPTA